MDNHHGRNCRIQHALCCFSFTCLFVAEILVSGAAGAMEAPESLRGAIEQAVDKVRPALVRIHVVETYYREGREMKFEATGSGVVITPEGHVITNHHVAGHAKQLKCTFADKEEIEAELVGTDPLTDIAVIKLKNDTGRVFQVAAFGDSDAIKVGEHVLAMGSPLALAQSVTLGIVSITEMIMPSWIERWGGIEQDGENVGALVRWIGHDAQIFGGNSGGPLVNLQGEIIGINEIKMGLGGAIPGNLSKEVAQALMAEGKVRRAWLGIEVQPRLKHDGGEAGVLVANVYKESPAEKAGLKSGDLILTIDGAPIDVRFPEQLPDFNRLVSALPIGGGIEVRYTRNGEEARATITTVEREPYQPKEYELKEWGVTVRDISFMLAREMKRKDTDGVLVTSVRPGGPAGDAKPGIQRDDVLLEVGGKPVNSVRTFKEVTEAIVKDASAPVPVLAGFERKTDRFVTVVKVGVSELQDPGLEVKKAWLPVETQVISRDIAELLGQPGMTGFRITSVYKGSTAEDAGLQIGDLILAVDGEKMTASAPEHYEELSALIRQYRVGTTAELSIRRGEEELKAPVELISAPKLAREMKKFRDDNFEFTVRDVTFFDKAKEQWGETQQGVLVDQIIPGSWAALAQLSVSDLILEVDGQPITDVAAIEAAMKSIAERQPRAVVFKVLRRIHTFFVELEPKWDAK